MPELVHHARGERSRAYDYRCGLGPGDPSTREQHDAYTVAVVRSGCFTYTVEGREHLLEAGSTLLGEPGVEYVVGHEHGGRDVCTVFELAPALLDELGSPRGFGARTLPASARLEAACHAPGAAGWGWDEAAVLAASEALSALGRAPRVADRLGTRVDRDRVHDAAAFLLEHVRERVALENAARVAGLSPFHFLRVFRRELGVTPHQFQVQARLRLALELLRSTSLPVTEVAYEVGFGDLSHFQHTFRRLVGVTPGRFRRGARPV